MHIALLTDGISPYVTGGMQRHSFYLAKYLLKAGHRVDLYHTGTGKSGEEKPDVFTAEEHSNLRSFSIPFPSLGKLPGHYIKESYAYSRSIYSVLSRQAKPDFIIAKGFSGWELLNRKKRGEKFPPVAVNFHGYEMFQPTDSLIERLKRRLLLQGPAMFCMKQADYLFSYGGKITTLLRDLGFGPEKIIEVPGGISSDWLVNDPAPLSKPIRFIFVGRHERRKGLPELNIVLKQLLKTEANKFQFDFIGPIPPTSQVSNNLFKYHGEITDVNEIRRLLRQADVLVCPSHNEGMPNVILEGMASGCAVIGTDTGAVSLMVDSAVGKLIEPANANQLGSAMIEMLKKTPGEMLELKKNAVSRIRTNFLWESIIEQTICALEEKLHRK